MGILSQELAAATTYKKHFFFKGHCLTLPKCLQSQEVSWYPSKEHLPLQPVAISRSRIGETMPSCQLTLRKWATPKRLWPTWTGVGSLQANKPSLECSHLNLWLTNTVPVLILTKILWAKLVATIWMGMPTWVLGFPLICLSRSKPKMLIS